MEFAIACLLASGLFGPPLSDLDRFSGENECWRQKDRYREYIERLRSARYVRGWDGGRWDDWREQAEFDLRCWELLAEAREAAWLRQSFQARQWLQRLKDHLGPDDYLRGRTPPLLPEWPSQDLTP